MPRRTRAELEKLLDQNSSYRHTDGRYITNKADLPTDAELAAQHRDHVTAVHAQQKDAGAKQADLDKLQAEIDEADRAAGAATKASGAAASGSAQTGGDGKSETPDAAAALVKAHTADELKALCDQHGCEHGTKPEMAAALVAKGVKPPQE